MKMRQRGFFGALIVGGLALLVEVVWRNELEGFLTAQGYVAEFSGVLT